MPGRAKHFDSTGSWSQDTAALELDRHFLTMVTLQQNTQVGQILEAYAVLSICEGGTDLQNRLGILAIGWVGPRQPLFWSGKLVVLAEHLLVVDLWGQSINSYDLLLYSMKILDTKDGRITIDP